MFRYCMGLLGLLLAACPSEPAVLAVDTADPINTVVAGHPANFVNLPNVQSVSTDPLPGVNQLGEVTRGSVSPTLPAIPPPPCQGLSCFSVQSFGAVGDGVTDDAEAIRAAFDAVIAAHGGTVYFPPGTYRVASSLNTINSTGDCADIDVVGVGSSSRIVVDSASGSVFEITGAESVRFEGLTFIGTANAPFSVVEITFVPHLVFRDCLFYGLHAVYAGIYLYGVQYPIFEDCSFRAGNIATAGAGLVTLDASAGISVKRVTFYDLGGLDGQNFTVVNMPSWIAIHDPAAWPEISASNNNVFRFEDVGLDEGGEVGIRIKPNTPDLRIGRVEMSGVNSNVSTAGIAVSRGVSIQQTDLVDIDNSWFGWTITANTVAIELIDAGTVSLHHVRTDTVGRNNDGASANVITADSATRSLSVTDSTYTTLASDAALTEVTTDAVVARLHKSACSIAANTLVKLAATDGQVTALTADDRASQAIGVALDTVSAAGAYVRVVEKFGQTVPILSDGTSAIAPGDALGISKESPGRVRVVTSGTILGRSLATVSATADAPVPVLWFKESY